jgi:hypothetical protein
MHFEFCKERQHSQIQDFSWLWCSWSSSGVSSRLVWLYAFFLSHYVHFVCSSGDNSAQTVVSLRRSNHEHFERLNLHTFF